MPDDSRPDKKPSKKVARVGKTSTQLRDASAKSKSSAKEAPKAPAKPTDTREFAVQHWARGRNDALTKAFVAEHGRGRVKKRTAAEWMKLYRKWLSEPRG